MKIFNRNQKKEVNKAKKINNIPGINNSPADTPVMKINPQHLNIIICISLESGQFTYSIKPKIKNEAGECANQKSYHCIISKP